MLRRPPISPLFPYTTLFRSVSPRIKCEIMVNHRNPEAGAEEIRRVAKNPGFVSIYTEFGGNYEPLGTSRHDPIRSEEHTSELQSRQYLVCRLLLEKKKARKF